MRLAEYFGFTDDEVKEMLRYYGLSDKFEVFKEWYDGYHFGNVDVYCPWDVINQCDRFCESRNAQMEPHWENSSSNAIVKDILEGATEATKADIEALISGECIEKTLVPELTYTDLDSSEAKVKQTYLWSVLYATGYLTDAGEANGKIHKLIIPNREVLGIYEEKIRSWFERKVISNTGQWQEFCTAVKNVDAESGIGYTDIKIVIPAEKTGCIIEVKYAEKGAFDSACLAAMKQIDDSGYAAALTQEGMQTIHKFGIACYKKSCKVIYSK